MGSIIKVFFGTKTMTFPKAVLICSLLTKYLTEAVLLDSWCPAGPQQWNDQYVNVGSGLAHSRRSEEILWEPRRNVRSRRNWISATLGRGGRRLADVRLVGTLRVRDWDAIAINKENGTSYIYVADFGDKKSFIYKFKEPRVCHRWRGRKTVISSREINRIRVEYPGHDCEAMVVDPLNGDILLFTKSSRRHQSKVYQVPQSSGASKTKTKKLEYVTTLPNMLVTGADISLTGDILALINKGEGWRWRKSDSLMAWADFLRTGPAPCRLYLEQFGRNVLKEKKTGWMVDFYAPWCFHSKNMMQPWAEAATRLKGRMKLGALDVDAHESIADQLNIQNLPTILYFAPGSSEP